MIKNPSPELLKKITTDRTIRAALARESHQWFFRLYLGHYIKYPSAPFHDELFAITENNKIRNAVIVAFRGSGKTTIMTLSHPIWAILGKQQKKCVLILGHTIYQARIYMKNIKEEFETNEVLKDDLGPFREEDEWQAFSLVLPKYNARIICASYEQGIRGLRHRQYRPDLIICDDVEDLESVRTLEGRDKVYQWFTGDVIPAGDQNTKVVVIGNLLHEDSLIMRLKKKIEEKQFDGIFREYPFMDNKGKVLWPGKFSTPESIEAEKRKIGDEIAWQREYMLRIIPEEGQVVHPEWIQFYEKLLELTPWAEHRFAAVSVDLAISERDSSNYTAILSAEVYGYRENLKIYFLPQLTNERLTFPETVERIKMMAASFGSPPKIFIEDVGYQKALIQKLESDGLKVEGFTPHGQDKRARLSLTTHLIQSGHVLFPRKGVEKLIQQLVGFGVEKYDDLTDSFSMLVLKVMESDNGGRFCFLRIDGRDFPSSSPTAPNNDKPKPENPKLGLLPEKILPPTEAEIKKAERELDLEIHRRDVERGERL